jgi:hypothetical protein
MAKVSAEVSDLFFNTDHGDAAVYDANGIFERYDEDALLDDATNFAGCIERAFGVAIEPSDLVEDYLDRV